VLQFDLLQLVETAAKDPILQASRYFPSIIVCIILCHTYLLCQHSFLARIVILPPCVPPLYASLLISLSLVLVALLMQSFSAAYASEVALEVAVEIGQDWTHQQSMETFLISFDCHIQCPREGHMWPSALSWFRQVGVS